MAKKGGGFKGEYTTRVLMNNKLDNDGVLPMFSFLAKTIKKAGEQAENPQEKKVAELMNKNIENAVIDYLG